MAGIDPALARPIWWTSFLVGAALLGAILVFGSRLLIPLAVAFMLWALINAIARLYRRPSLSGLRLPEALCRLLAVVTIIGFGWIVVDISARNLTLLREAAPDYQARLLRMVEQLLGTFNIDRTTTINEIVQRLDVAGILFSLTTGLGALLGNIGLVALYVAFMLLEQRRFGRKVDALFDDERRATVFRRSLAEIQRRVERYIWVKSAISLVTAVICYAVLVMVGIDFASLWALLIFLFNFVPNIGSLFAVLLPSLLTLLQFDAWTPFFAVLAALTAIQMTMGNYVEPRLMGTTLNLSPFVIILSLTFWGGVWGVAGMFLSVPITVIIAIVLAKFAPTRPVAILLSSDGRLDE